MKYLSIVGLTFFILLHFPFANHEVCSFDSNDWFDECPDQNCGAPPAGGQGGGGGGGGPIIVSYDLGPLFSLDEDWDAANSAAHRQTPICVVRQYESKRKNYVLQ